MRANGRTQSVPNYETLLLNRYIGIPLEYIYIHNVAVLVSIPVGCMFK